MHEALFLMLNQDAARCQRVCHDGFTQPSFVRNPTCAPVIIGDPSAENARVQPYICLKCRTLTTSPVNNIFILKRLSLRPRELKSKALQRPNHTAVSSLRLCIDEQQQQFSSIIYVCIVEIEQVAGLIISRQRPTVALCDVASRTSWVSSQFVDELETISRAGIGLANSTSFRKEGEPPRIHIRWSCGLLGQAHEEGTFFIEPKARFKILFGCAYSTNHLPTKHFRSRRSTRTKGKRIEPQPHIRDQAVESFRAGVETGILVPLERMNLKQDNRPTLMPIADVEVDLDYTWQLYSGTDQALNDGPNQSDSSNFMPSFYGNVFSPKDITSANSSVNTDERDHMLESTDASFSESSYQSTDWIGGPSGAQHHTEPGYMIGSWANQSVYEEPQYWAVPRMMYSEPRPWSIQRCRDLTPEHRTKLAAAQESAGKEAEKYWQWDEEEKKYKHYDEGCADPVWYNPP
ncbi:uncharacterized protein LY89DRAFT_670331 [Mollisia scopiformis]|uniref:Uncharacterized protein n=1 Tax=Mollisia scopiformis TaxID=149040 RepID=A0A194X7K8_MOLSC|nr:uncharacterized protein LY89DRAFT_670331 [Mollisia scopiformis]KUJ15787.1 hypothetical protein LY89DRAFT_670331 [Mollisia scopiformis]